VGNRHSSPSLLSCSFQVTGREISVLISTQFHSLFRCFSYFNVVSVRFVESLENDLTVGAKTTEMKITDFSSGSYATVFRDVFHCWIDPNGRSTERDQVPNPIRSRALMGGANRLMIMGPYRTAYIKGGRGPGARTTKFTMT
jgi:hypothetical protein